MQQFRPLRYHPLFILMTDFCSGRSLLWVNKGLLKLVSHSFAAQSTSPHLPPNESRRAILVP